MSYSLDVNILLYASNTQNPFYKRASNFLMSCFQSEEICYLTWGTVYGFLRLSTHSSIFKIPLSHEKALANINTLKMNPRFRFLSSDDNSWNVYERLQQEMPIKGNLVPYAVIASILEANGIKKIFTKDRDFNKFPYLRPEDPLS